MVTTYPQTFELPTTDAMTGLLTAPYFRHLLREELLPHAKEADEPLSVFFFDADNFVEINEAHGRDAGDAVLCSIAATLREALPEAAAIVRYGGDEFGAALPDTRLDDAFTLCEELRRRVAALTFAAFPEARIRCCIGLAAFPTHAASDHELVRGADQALYYAKATGRDKVALPLADSRMITKTSYYTATQLERLAHLAKTLRRNEASVLREALDDALKKYNDQLSGLPRAAKES